MLVIYNTNGTVDLMATREAMLGNLSEEEMVESEADRVWTEYIHSLHAKKESEPIVEMVETPEQKQEFWSDPCWTKSF